MRGKFLFRKKVRTYRTVFDRKVSVAGTLLVYDDDLRFIPDRSQDYAPGGGIIDYCRFEDMVSVDVKGGVYSKELVISTRRGTQSFRCLAPGRLAEKLHEVQQAHALAHGGAGQRPIAG
jgi:hypothetical protein